MVQVVSTYFKRFFKRIFRDGDLGRWEYWDVVQTVDVWWKHWGGLRTFHHSIWLVELVAFCRSYFTAKVKIATLSKVVPCSRVGHIFRSWSPYPWRTGNLMTKIISGLTTISMNDDLNLKCIFSSSDILFSDINVLTYNPLRVAEVWMDDYRYLQSCCIFLCFT